MKKSISFRKRVRARLIVLVFIGVHAFSLSGAEQFVTKEALLQNVVRDVIVPGYQDLSAKCHALSIAAEDFGKAPTQESLEKARKAWVDASLASRRIQWLQIGPIADREYIASFCYAKVLPVRIEGAINSARTLDEAYLEELGATAKGLFALEYLLFDPLGDPAPEGNRARKPALDLFSPAESSRRREYVVALAKDLDAKANQLVNDWTASGDQAAAAKFVAGGQESLNRLVNNLAQHTELILERRLNFVLELPQPISRQLGRIENSLSGTSQQSAVALLQGAQKLYRGNDATGLEGYLKGLNAPLAERMRGQFEQAVIAVQAIGAPLEQVVITNRPVIASGCEKARSLEILCKTDLASALGVTITFNSGDGD